MKQITQVPHVCIIFKESSGLWITCVINLLGCQDLQLIFWDKHTSVIPFLNCQDKVYPPNTIWDQIKAVHLLKIALLVTGQWVTDCVSIKLFMLYSQGQRWKMGLRGCKYWPKTSLHRDNLQMRLLLWYTASYLSFLNVAYLLFCSKS